MKRAPTAILVSLGAWAFLAGGPVHAQYPYGPGRVPAPLAGPTVSPYLNLLRAGNPTFLNYYGLVRPQLEFGVSIQRLQQQVGVAQQTATEAEAGARLPLPPTGRPVGFQTQYRYFQNLGALGGITRAQQPLVGRPGLPTTQTQLPALPVRRR
jgi:hypothetical protein